MCPLIGSHSVPYAAGFPLFLGRFALRMALLIAFVYVGIEW